MRISTFGLVLGAVLVGRAGDLQAQARPVWVPLFKDANVLFDLDSASWARNPDKTISLRLRTAEPGHGAPPGMFMVRVLDVDCAKHSYRLKSQAMMNADSIRAERPVADAGWRTPNPGWQEDTMVRVICERGQKP